MTAISPTQSNVAAGLGQFPPAALGFTQSQIIVRQQNRVAEPQSGVFAVMTMLALQLEAKVKGEKLSGRRRVRVRKRKPLRNRRAKPALERATGLEPVTTGWKPDALAAKLSPQTELEGQKSFKQQRTFPTTSRSFNGISSLGFFGLSEITLTLAGFDERSTCSRRTTIESNASRIA